MVGSFNDWLPLLMEDCYEIHETEFSEQSSRQDIKLDLQIKKLKNQKSADIEIEKKIITSGLKLGLLDLVEKEKTG